MPAQPFRLVRSATRRTGATDTARALAEVRRALAEADPSDPTIVALKAVIALIEPPHSGGPDATPAPSPTRSRLISAAEAARACGLTKEAMVKRLRRLRIGQKVVGRWYVDREALSAHCPEFGDRCA